MGTGTIRSQPELGHEENIAVKNSHASGRNSSVDGKHISDFMGKRRGDLHLTADLPVREMSHGAMALPRNNFDRVNKIPRPPTSDLYKAKACAIEGKSPGCCLH
jgi:hypothetical protein